MEIDEVRLLIRTCKVERLLAPIYQDISIRPNDAIKRLLTLMLCHSKSHA